MPNLKADLYTYQAMKERLLIAFPELAEDEETLNDTLAGCTSLQDAIGAVIRWAEEDRTLAAALSIRIDELEQRRKRIEERMEKKRALVAEVMGEANVKKIQFAEFTAVMANGAPHVVITDEAALPAHFLVLPPPKPDKRAILQTLKEGIPVSGAVLSNPQPHLTIRRS